MAGRDQPQKPFLVIAHVQKLGKYLPSASNQLPYFDQTTQLLMATRLNENEINTKFGNEFASDYEKSPKINAPKPYFYILSLYIYIFFDVIFPITSIPSRFDT